MSNSTKTILSALVSAGCAALATWFIAKKYYREQYKQELEEVREYYRNRKPTEDILTGNPDKADPTVEEIAVAEHFAKEYGAGQAVEETLQTKDIPVEQDDDCEEPETDENEPSMIYADEYAGDMEHDCVTFHFYPNGVLCDDGYNVIRRNEWDQYVPEDFADHYGEYDDDVVYVHNPRLKINIEIIREPEPYVKQRK